MQAKEYRTVDKSEWGHGPWQDEPDKAQWQDEATGLPCLIVRNHGGALCGYVGVPDTHPWHGKGYSNCVTGCGADWCEHSPDSQTNVHGGLTFASACAKKGDESENICHIPDPGEPDNVWWFGFDCAHCNDLAPGYESRNRDRGWPMLDGKYRDIDYVKAEIRGLAQQLVSVQ